MLPQYTETAMDKIDGVYDRMTTAFKAGRTQSLAYRLFNLKQIAFLIHDNEERIKAAVHADLSKGGYDVQMSDLWPMLHEIELAVKRLPEWMKDESATKDSSPFFRTLRPHVVKQPKGVCLIIGAWNYPWMLSVGPLIGAVAAGCPVVLKLSEHAPTSSALLAELLPRYLDPECYEVVLGDHKQATKLLEKQWGHILFTGNGAVGKIVAEAAAKTLTPTTLELGGKSPVIVSSDADLKVSARRLISMKALNVGQVCVTPDYVLCVKDRIDEFAKEITKTLDEFYPKGSSRSFLGEGPQTVSLRSGRDFDRISTVLESAESKGQLLYRGETDAERRRMGLNVVRLPANPEGQGLLVEEEVFGPIITLIPVDSVDAAIKYIKDRPHPLSLYVLSSKRSVFDKVIAETISGSAIWNDFLLVPACATLPFGGVGDSGWGAYHGVYGFDTFTHKKAILEVPLWMEFAQTIRYAPNFNARSQGLLKMFMKTRTGFSRPVSVEHEQMALERQRTIKRVLIALAIVIMGAAGGTAARHGVFNHIVDWVRSRL